MSPQAINNLYFIGIAIFSLVMIFSPRSFLGKAKYDEDAVKTEGILKKSGIVLLILSIGLVIYTTFIK